MLPDLYLDGFFIALGLVVLSVTFGLMILDSKMNDPVKPKTMHKSVAVGYAVEALSSEIHKIAVDANLHDQLGADYPYAVRASQKRKLLIEARRVLEELQTELK